MLNIYYKCTPYGHEDREKHKHDKEKYKSYFKKLNWIFKDKKKSLDEIKSRLDTVEKNIREHEAIAIEIIHNEHRKKMPKQTELL